MIRRIVAQQFAAFAFASLCSTSLVAQILRPRPDNPVPKKSAPAAAAEPAPVVIAIGVPAGVPIKVAVNSEIRIRKVGQKIQGRTVEPVYAFDKLLIPAGTAVNGKVAAIDPVPMKTRVMDATDGNFSPVRHIHVEFDSLNRFRGFERRYRSMSLKP